MTLISPTTRHLIHLGTETTIGTASSQDDMFLRFSDQEKINVYPPSATNSAGTYRLQDGSKIMGGIVAKENILIWTDNALYSMKFVGAPYTFGFEQVGTNCGLIGQNAVVEIDARYFRPTDVQHLLGDPTKAKKEIGWIPKVTFKELIKIMVNADYQKQKSRNGKN